jgi:DNA-binding NtrC family response regulator
VKALVEQNIIGSSKAIKKVIKTVLTHAKFPTPVIVTGETGTGKELAARGLHYAGPLSSKPFIAVNSSTFSDDLFVSELFGYKKGAFTDAKNDHPGLLSAAEGGSLFLDEIDSLSLKSQAALLRFLQEKEYRPIGCNKTHKANVRLIVASNHSLPDLVANGVFREDLYYRLLILTINMPPLRERREDIFELVEHFIVKLNKQYGLGKQGMSSDLLNLMLQHNWPGNVRELENTVHRLYLTSENDILEDVSELELFAPKDLKKNPQELKVNSSNSIACSEKLLRTGHMTFAGAKKQAVEAFEYSFVEQVMTFTNGNVTQAANLCGKERRAFGKLVKKYNIEKFSSSTI